MPFPTYTISTETSGLISEKELHSEIVSAGPYDAPFIGVSVTGDELHVHCTGLSSGDDVAAIDAVVTAHDHSLSVAKVNKIAAIDGRTEALIDLGFIHSAQNFSLSLASQSKMTAAHQIKDHVAFVYPVKWNTRQDDGAHEIVDSTEMDTFYLSAIGTIRAHLDSGTALKDAVRAATTVAEVDAVVDNR